MRQVNLRILALFPALSRKYSSAVQERPNVPPVDPISTIERGLSRGFVRETESHAAIDGIIEEADDTASEVEDKAVLDAALINAAQAAEHYEITRYGSLIAWAKQLGRNDCASILQKTLDEEKATDKKLTTLAESRVNLRAAS